MPSIAIPVSLRGQLLSGARQTLTNILFSANEPGFTFEPWDITTLYQDRAGTTPVTAVGQSVGLRLDKSKGLVPSANIASPTSVTGVAIGGPAFTNYIVTPTLTANTAYEISFTVSGYSGSGDVGVAASGSRFSPAISTAVISGNGVVRFIGFNTTTAALGLYTRSTNTANFSAISVRELPGNHQVAINDAARTVYGREPKTGTRNRLTYTEQFDNAVWTLVASTVSANSILAPDGTTTADAVTATAGAGVHYVAQTVSVTAATAYTLSFYAKAGTNSFIQLLNNGDTGTFADFDLATGTVGTVGSDTTASIVSVGSGWYRCIASFSSAATLLTSFRVYLVPASTSPYGAGFTAAGTEIAYIWGAQLELGASATAYQKAVSQYDITESGVPSCYYVQTDGVDDAYVTPTITPGTDKAQVFAGVRKLSDAAVGMVVEHSATIASNNGAFYIAAPITAGAANYHFVSKGTGPVSATYTNAAVAAPATNVITGLGDISGDRATLRINGVQVAQSTADQGTGNYLAYPAYIYARGGTTLPFNGRDYGHAVRFGPNLDAATIAQVEALIARNTPTVTL